MDCRERDREREQQNFAYLTPYMLETCGVRILVFSSRSVWMASTPATMLPPELPLITRGSSPALAQRKRERCLVFDRS